MCKGLEALKQIAILETGDGPEITVEDILPTQFEVIEKELKAFDIIKEKCVDMYRLAVADNVVSYNNWTEFDEYWLTEKEFNLLKEVLKNE